MNGSPPNAAAPRSSGLGLWVHAYGPALWAAVVFLVALYFFLLSTQFKFAPRPGRLGPAAWPQAILILLMITAAFDCFVEARKARARAALRMLEGATESGPPRVWWLMALGLALTLAYVNLATVLGFPLANTLFMLAFMLLAGFARPFVALIISLLGTFTLVLLFVKIVYVSLPIGTGPFEELTLLIYSLLGIG